MLLLLLLLVIAAVVVVVVRACVAVVATAFHLDFLRTRLNHFIVYLLSWPCLSMSRVKPETVARELNQKREFYIEFYIVSVWASVDCCTRGGSEN